MTVKELKEKLKEIDDDLEVLIYEKASGHFGVIIDAIKQKEFCILEWDY